MTSNIGGKEFVVRGRVLRTAALRHEWCEFLEYAPRTVEQLRDAGVRADLFTFVNDFGTKATKYDFHHETVSAAALPVTTYEKWWDGMGFKPRNKVRKGQKSGVELKIVPLDDAFAQGVESIYNESPIRQGRKFYHYGKNAREIRQELESFLPQCTLVGAYCKGELVGFMKLFHGENVLRTIHIIAKLAHREKCIMDVLIAKAVELCAKHKMAYLHYGSWTDGGVGVFREKFGFIPIELPRYFVPLSLRGRLMLQLKFHRPIKEWLPEDLVGPLLQVRTKLNSFRYRQAKGLAEA